MNSGLPHNKLQVHYRVLQQGETATVWVAGTTAGDTVTERLPAWILNNFIYSQTGLLESPQLDWTRKYAPASFPSPNIKMVIDFRASIRSKKRLQSPGCVFTQH